MFALFARNNFTEFAVCGIVFVAVFGVIAFIIGLIVFKLKQNSKNRAVWQELSRNTNLAQSNPQKLGLAGAYNGCELKLAVGVRSSGSGDSRSVEHFTYCTSRFPYPLRFLLQY